ncbi:MAG: 2-hydroxy-3-oxopropionate reductase [Alphaproteobacteria bacterium MarineAlpha5_Bin5]|nr:MAG: 2-hydroxy-3-oxopropionate reductase [Alphaproteobacteria bacterium MarineAlpha5_Bin5]PPR49409.1 MAG: 2-hydroxy-3-oxopropionate reductase [Alphaproteobacteria bacterium MarineAlpha5_Bin4]|tara:strand:- start:2949 stop:3821 length:873 start_codon:yes stop_codon:yes gene_type:complete
MSISNVSFIGLGVMGYPMAGHLKKNKYNVTVFNRTNSKSKKWVDEFNGKLALTPGEASSNSDIVFICVGRDEDLIEVMEGENGIISNIKKNSIIVDHTTASANIARRFYDQLKDSNLNFLDAPISGGQVGAEKGILSIMVGGDKNEFDIVKPVLESYGKTIELIGPSGSGQLAKMINQICIAGLVQGLSEAMAFGKKAQLDMEKVISVISKGAAQSWQMENRYRTMLDGEFNFGFAVDWMRKDLSICFDEAKKNGSLLPITKFIDDYYAQIQKNGGSRFDTSSLMTLVDK